MKGIILAGGSGTRMYPLSLTLNKHLLPVYDKPMIYYPLSTLMLAGLRDILLISTPQDLPLFQSLLSDGSQWGLNFSYLSQATPDGLAQAFILGEDFIGRDEVCLILGDNLFQGSGLAEKFDAIRQHPPGASIFAHHVDNPYDYGIVEFNQQHKAIAITEKPKQPKSNYAIPGIYFYDNDVIDIAKSIRPSDRGEYEISDVNSVYLAQNKLTIEILGRGFTWLDMGTPQSLLKASNYIEMIETRQGLKIGCPDEIAWRKGYIDDEQLIQLSQQGNPAYQKYIAQLVAAVS